MSSDSDGEHPRLELSDSELTIDNVSDSLVADDELRNQIRQAQIILVPNYVNSQDGRIPVFPDGTEQLFRFLQEELNESTVEAAIADEDYVEHALHHDEIRLADILLASAEWLPVVVEALNVFLKACAGMRWRDATVESEIHYKDSAGKFVSVDYRGPVDSYKCTLQKLFPDEDASGMDAEEPADEN